MVRKPIAQTPGTTSSSKAPEEKAITLAGIRDGKHDAILTQFLRACIARYHANLLADRTYPGSGAWADMATLKVDAARLVMIYGLTNDAGDGVMQVMDENCLQILEEYGNKPPPSEKEAERIKKMHMSWVEKRSKDMTVKAQKAQKVVKKVAKKPVPAKKDPVRRVRKPALESGSSGSRGSRTSRVPQRPGASAAPKKRGVAK